jgi:hypothetical protein
MLTSAEASPWAEPSVTEASPGDGPPLAVPSASVAAVGVPADEPMVPVASRHPSRTRRLVNRWRQGYCRLRCWSPQPRRRDYSGPHLGMRWALLRVFISRDKGPAGMRPAGPWSTLSAGPSHPEAV